jgi:hypothetical protein
VAAGCAALVWAAGIGTSQAATAQTSTTATVLLPITITKTLDHNFGKFMSGVGAAAGTVEVGTDNPQSVTGGVTTNAALGASAKAATFTVTGEPLSTYAITYPAQTTLVGPGGSTPMTIGSFTEAVDAGTVVGRVGTFTAAGSQELTVGATLTVNANQAPGTYAGTLDVEVNYN